MRSCLARAMRLSAGGEDLAGDDGLRHLDGFGEVAVASLAAGKASALGDGGNGRTAHLAAQELLLAAVVFACDSLVAAGGLFAGRSGSLLHKGDFVAVLVAEVGVGADSFAGEIVEDVFDLLIVMGVEDAGLLFVEAFQNPLAVVVRGNR